MARSLLPFDEISALKLKVKRWAEDGSLKTKDGKAECIDAILDLLILSYVYGNNAANEMLNGKSRISVDEMQKTVYRKVDGKTFADRVEEYADEETAAEDIARVIETESHHAYDSSAESSAKSNGAKRKKWRTMQDLRVRDAHEYLDGVVVGMSDDFYTFDGKHAPFPGAFNDAANDVRCRCWVEYMK